MIPVSYFAYIQELGPSEFLVRFFDIPEAITQGDTLEEAKANAYDALQAAVEVYVERGMALPIPSSNLPARADVDGGSTVSGFTLCEVAVDPKLAALDRLAKEMNQRGLTKSALARLMGIDEKAARVILSGRGASLDRILDALRAVGVRPALAA
jgi:antitoxin HicB